MLKAIDNWLSAINTQPTAVLFGTGLLLYNPKEITALKSVLILANYMCIPENTLSSLLALKKKTQQKSKHKVSRALFSIFILKAFSFNIKLRDILIKVKASAKVR